MVASLTRLSAIATILAELIALASGVVISGGGVGARSFTNGELLSRGLPPNRPARLQLGAPLSVRILVLSSMLTRVFIPLGRRQTGASATVAPPSGPTGTPVCTKTYTAEPGDYCFLIATEFGITVQNLVAYNPNVNAGCTNIIPGMVRPSAGASSGEADSLVLF